MPQDHPTPPSPEDALAQAIRQAHIYCDRTYMKGNGSGFFHPIEDFRFMVQENAPTHIECHKNGRLWATMRAQPSDNGGWQVEVVGEAVRIDAVGVMLSYLALLLNANLSYNHEILKQSLVADQNGSLCLN